MVFWRGCGVRNREFVETFVRLVLTFVKFCGYNLKKYSTDFLKKPHIEF